ncbi:hypothetical protein DXT99_26360 [Pontibacter diazotrophicus]|uniref:Uncharacterized protein n=1 Tax=Pontibacter diazotrophicus TaxID=1400979 RepID=A0A3D8KZ87_9BACT|nr:hypothetical protein DXT99_26360 [Pontibacter diazotrophicus]
MGLPEAQQLQSGTLTWSRNGNTTGSIDIRVNTRSDEPCLELDYKYRENFPLDIIYRSSRLAECLAFEQRNAILSACCSF